MMGKKKLNKTGSRQSLALSPSKDLIDLSHLIADKPRTVLNRDDELKIKAPARSAFQVYDNLESILQFEQDQLNAKKKMKVAHEDLSKTADYMMTRQQYLKLFNESYIKDTAIIRRKML